MKSISIEIQKKLIDFCSKQYLDIGLKMYIYDFLKSNRRLYQRKGLNQILTTFDNKPNRSYTLEEGAWLYGSVFCDKDIFELFLTEIPLALKKGILGLAESTSLLATELSEITGLNYQSAAFYFFPSKGHYYGNGICMFPSIIRRQINDFQNLIQYDLTPISVPKKTDYIYLGTKHIHNDFSLLLQYARENEIKITKEGRPTITSAKKAIKITNLEEFYVDNKATLSTLKTLISISLINDIPQKKSLHDFESTEALISYVLKEIYLKPNRNSVFDIFYYHKPIYKYNLTSIGVENEIINNLKTFPINGWLSFEKVFNCLQTNCDLRPIEPSIGLAEIYGTLHESRNSKKIKNKYQKYIQEPFVKGTFFLFAALGLVDIAYNKNGEQEAFKGDIVNPYEELKYVRLNEFGAFILGVNDNYASPEEAVNNDLYISSEALVITAGEGNMAAEIILGNYMTKISDTRYITDYERFLSGCESFNDIQTKINRFKKTLNLAFPKNWEMFFEFIIDKTKSIEKQYDYEIYQLKYDLELLRLVSRDEILRDLVMKAENYFIIVEKINVAKFKARLLKFGYFLK